MGMAMSPFGWTMCALLLDILTPAGFGSGVADVMFAAAVLIVQHYPTKVMGLYSPLPIGLQRTRNGRPGGGEQGDRV